MRHLLFVIALTISSVAQSAIVVPIPQRTSVRAMTHALRISDIPLTVAGRRQLAAFTSPILKNQAVTIVLSGGRLAVISADRTQITQWKTTGQGDLSEPRNRTLAADLAGKLSEHLASYDAAAAAQTLAAAFDGQTPPKTTAEGPFVTVPEQLVADGMPKIPQALARDVGGYLQMRTASFTGWHPTRREMLILTRFADSAQVHYVATPGGARRQLTFLPEPVSSAKFKPKTAEYILYMQDSGGGENHQIYRLDLKSGRSTLLTDGKSRHQGMKWARNGRFIVFTSNRRNGSDDDIYMMDPMDPGSTRMVAAMRGNGWGIQSFAKDNNTLLLRQGVSINESRLFLLDMKTGLIKRVAPAEGERVAYAQSRFSEGGKSILTISNRDSDFRRLVRLDPKTGAETVLSADVPWDVEEFSVTGNGKRIAYLTNEDGVSVLRIISGAGTELAKPKVPMGVMGGLRWHHNSEDLAFTGTKATAAGDVYSFNMKTQAFTRWTHSETGGIDAEQFSAPELVRIKSFDGLEISGFLYRPDPAKFPGKRPVAINIHGGPEGQSRPGFQGRNNYIVNELGVAMFFPNVRGSEGYGTKFLDLDNGYKREDSVKDIGAFIDWLGADATLDSDRIAVMGGSYGGYMTLASLVHYSDKLRGGIDLVGISNFVTFLENTQSYRRDLRRVEYGDERDPKMSDFLHKISPLNNVERIKKPLFVIQGKNDPRVPVGEAEQIVKAVRAAGREAWYLLGLNEGHGFAKKANADYLFLAMVVFLTRYLLPKGPGQV